MVLRHGVRAIPSWLLAASLTAGAAGCGDHSRGTGTGEGPIAAVVDGTPISERELDDSLAPQLRELDRSRYEMRLKQLQQLIAARVLGDKRAERDGDKAFRAATAQADVEIRLVPPTVSSAPDPNAAAAALPDSGEADGDTPRRSALPLTLIGTLVRDDPAKSMAAVRVPGALLARNVLPGHPIVDGAVLVRVERNRILLRHKGALEFVPLSVTSEPSTPTPARTVARFARTPDTVLSLRRGDMDRALRDIPMLERSLTHAAPELDGRRLLVLASVEPGSLYDLLQLQERDVLMQVNGEWVDDRRNPLWDALRADGTVTLLVMRAGQPQSFAYDIN